MFGNGPFDGSVRDTYGRGNGGFRGRGRGGDGRGGGRGGGRGRGRGGSSGPVTDRDVYWTLRRLLDALDCGDVERFAKDTTTNREAVERVSGALQDPMGPLVSADSLKMLWAIAGHAALAAAVTRNDERACTLQSGVAGFLEQTLKSPLLHEVAISGSFMAHERLMLRFLANVEGHCTSAVFQRLTVPRAQLLLRVLAVPDGNVKRGLEAVAAPRPAAPPRAPARGNYHDHERKHQVGVDRDVTYLHTPTVPAVGGAFDPPPVRTVTTHGPLVSVDHHIDAVYHMRRADALLPLHNSIEQLRRARNGGDAPDRGCAQHYAVRVAGYGAHRTHGTVTKFKFPLMKRVRWQRTKRLSSSSMVLIVTDDLELTSVSFGFVADSSHEKETIAQRQEGFVDIALKDPTLLMERGRRQKPYLLLDTGTLWDSFAYVLDSLRHVTADTLPFADVIRCDGGADNAIDVAPAPPPGDRHDAADGLLEFSDDDALGLLDMELGAVVQRGDRAGAARTIVPTEEAVAEFCAAKTFDDTQRRAFEHIMRSKFAVVQGPPGTGKSYVGVAATQFLLEHSPDERILLIGYTNHAVDAALLAIRSGREGHLCPGKVVRLGSRTREEELKPFLLHALGQAVQVASFYPVFCKYEEAIVVWGSLALLPDLVRAIRTCSVDVDNDPRRRSTLKLPTPEDVGELWVDGDLPAVHDALAASVQRLMARRSDLLDRQQVLKQDVSECNDVLRRDTLSRHERDEIDNYVAQARAEFASLEAEIGVVAGQFNTFLMDWVNERAADSAVADDDDGEEDPTLGYDDGANAATAGLGVDLDAIPACVAGHGRFVGVERLTAAQRREVVDYVQSRWQERAETRVAAAADEFERAIANRGAVQQDADIRVLRKARLVVATTSGAARNIQQLRQVGFTTVVVEEAAEIAEADLLACLVPSSKRNVLIGDHQQLPPKVNVFELVARGADTSLMERLVVNGADYVTLDVQRRMRPAICDLVRFLYAERLRPIGGLKDHESVKTIEGRPHVSGLGQDVTFLNHNLPEDNTGDHDGSHSHRGEAAFILMLALYLINQGTPAHEITILTPYSGQVLVFIDTMRKTWNGRDRVAVKSVDDFQGEESDVVLVSLVRTTAPGFVQAATRVCVMHSRARRGMVVVGRLATFRNERKMPAWAELFEIAAAAGQVKDKLQLKCWRHGNTAEFTVTDGVDPLWGCGEQCGRQKKCGHVCRSRCHGCPCEDFLCEEPCPKKCPAGHRCVSKCYQACPPCETPVKDAETGCALGHKVNLPCREVQHLTAGTCPVKVPLQLQHCGHSGQKVCGSGAVCRCLSACGTKLLCGHNCGSTCAECVKVVNGALQTVRHQRCEKPCDRRLECGHRCTEPCASVCPPCKRPCPVLCSHRECEHECGQPCIPCVEPCSRSCPHRKCSNLCAEPCDVPPCDEPCPKTLKCGHPCPGLCGEKCPAAVCRECRGEREVFFGTENDEDARFVVAGDCGHCVEVSGMDGWVEQWAKARTDGGQVGFPVCPLCEGAVKEAVRCGRYRSELATAAADLAEVKARKVRELAAAVDTALTARRTLAESLPEMRRRPAVPAGTRQPTTALQDLAKLGDGAVTEFNAVGEDHNVSLCVRFTHIASSILLLWRLVFKPHQHRDLSALRPTVTHLTELVRGEDGTLSESASVFGAEVRAATDAVLLATLRVVSPDAVFSLPPCPAATRTTAADTEGLAAFRAALELALRQKTETTAAELREIHAVLAQGGAIQDKGAWMRCRCGALYVIGDCGGATTGGTCPECKGAIGGQGYHEAAGNTRTGIADGSTQEDRPWR